MIGKILFIYFLQKINKKIIISIFKHL